MANEVTVRAQLQIRKGSKHYNSPRTVFRATIESDPVRGPSPGFVLVPIEGVDVEFTDLVAPSLCRIENGEDEDSGNYITYGIHDPETGKFYPLGEVLAGEFYDLRLSRFLQGEYGTGSGTVATGPLTNRLRLKATTGDAACVVDAFDF